MNTLYVRCQTKDYILDIVAARAGMRINKVNSVRKDAFPQHNISNAEYKEIVMIGGDKKVVSNNLFRHFQKSIHCNPESTMPKLH